MRMERFEMIVAHYGEVTVNLMAIYQEAEELYNSGKKPGQEKMDDLDARVMARKEEIEKMEGLISKMERCPKEFEEWYNLLYNLWESTLKTLAFLWLRQRGGDALSMN